MSTTGCIIIAGPPLHGKSTLAQLVSRLISPADVHEVDDINKELFPDTFDTLLEEKRELEIMITCYRTACDRARHSHDTGRQSLILATFSRREFKQVLHGLCAAVPTSIFLIQTLPFDVITARIARRAEEGSTSNIRTKEQYEWSLSLIAPWWTGASVTMLNGEEPPESLAKVLLQSAGTPTSTSSRKG